MKTLYKIICLGIFLFPGLAFSQIAETPAVIGLTQGGNPQGFIQGSNAQGVIFSPTQGGKGNLIPYTNIRGEGLGKQIRLDDRMDQMAGPQAYYAAGQFNEAAEAYGKVATDYAIILNIPMNFASEALFYQMESLKRSGQYEGLVALVNSPQAETIKKQLPDAYKRPLEFLKLWALLGAKDFTALKTALEVYQEPVTGDAKLLSAPNFIKMPTNETAEIAFLRAKVYESEGAKDKALDDYYRSFTFTFGNNVLLAKLAMGAAMMIHKEDPKVAAEDPMALNQMRSIAYLYSKRFGIDSMPEALQVYAVKPVVDYAPPAEETKAGDAETDLNKAAPATEGRDKEAAPTKEATAEKAETEKKE